jgi:hypothetical protein
VLEKLLHMSALFDFYGALLTEKQQRCLEMHFFDDLSLSEIANELGISRQAIYDIIHRSEQSLNDYELKLNLVAKYKEERLELQSISKSVEKLRGLDNKAEINDILKRLSSLIGKVKEA